MKFFRPNICHIINRASTVTILVLLLLTCLKILMHKLNRVGVCSLHVLNMWGLVVVKALRY